MTEQNLLDDLHQRLSKYMYDPPISMFVSHYGSREVAVMGAVAKPDLYTLESGSDTLMGMISRAGGMTPDSSGKLLFVPNGTDGIGIVPTESAVRKRMLTPGTQIADSNLQVSDAEPSKVSDSNPHSERPSASDITAQRENQSGPSGSTVARLHPIIIWMNDPTMRSYLELPARPGDLLMVPAAGQVTVGGWVRSPGGFAITNGMTALSAISAAGGALFSSSAQVLRVSSDGGRSSIPLSISRVKKGEEADVPVQSGDIVLVDSSAAGALPYFVYTLFSKFGTGVAVPIP